MCFISWNHLVRWTSAEIGSTVAVLVAKFFAAALYHEVETDCDRIRFLGGSFVPDLVDPLSAVLAPPTVIDGNLIVGDAARGRCDFSGRPRRLAAGRDLHRRVRRHPARFVAFDLLPDGRGTKLLDPCHCPSAVTCSSGCLPALRPLSPCAPQTESRMVAHQRMSQSAVAGTEGVVAHPGVAHRAPAACPRLRTPSGRVRGRHPLGRDQRHAAPDLHLGLIDISNTHSPGWPSGRQLKCFVLGDAAKDPRRRRISIDASKFRADFR
jgi:hypothetical protein